MKRLSLLLCLVTALYACAPKNAEEAFINDLAITTARPVERVPIGSSLKLCLVAEGSADVYPRIAPTMHWDTAAAHAVVVAAGGQVLDYNTNEPLTYQSATLANPFFVAYSRDFT